MAASEGSEPGFYGLRFELAPGQTRTGLRMQVSSGCTVTGLVRDADSGKPQPSVGIRSVGAYGPVGSESDQDGQYRLEGLRPNKSQVTLWLDSPEFCLIPEMGRERTHLNVLLEGYSATQDLLVRQAPKVTGVIRSPDGEPLPGARIDLRRLSVSQAEAVFSRSDGSYETFADENCFTCLRVSAADYPPTEMFFQVGRESIRIDVALSPGCEVQGLVLDEAGTPISDAVVIARDKDESHPPTVPPVRTDVSGAFHLRALPVGRIRLQATVLNHSASEPVVLELQSGKGVYGLRLTLQRVFSLSIPLSFLGFSCPHFGPPFQKQAKGNGS